MTIGGAIAELQNLINANDVPFYYKGGIRKVIETISMEFVERNRRIEALEHRLEMYEKAMVRVIQDEPQTETSTNDEKLQSGVELKQTEQTEYERGKRDAWKIAQTVFDSTVTLYEAEDVAKQIDKDINVRSKDEPQTERSSE